jgi:hypothetical protein
MVTGQLGDEAGNQPGADADHGDAAEDDWQVGKTAAQGAVGLHDFG